MRPHNLEGGRQRVFRARACRCCAAGGRSTSEKGSVRAPQSITPRLASDARRLRVIIGPEDAVTRLVVYQDAPEGIYWTMQRRNLLRLTVKRECTFDHQQAYLAVEAVDGTIALASLVIGEIEALMSVRRVLYVGPPEPVGFHFHAVDAVERLRDPSAVQSEVPMRVNTFRMDVKYIEPTK